MDEPRVSVVIPVFNQARYLAEALDGVAAQTYRSLECIVVDDGSTDDSAAVAEARPGVHVLRLGQNQGASAARNAAIAVARGEMIAHADADDVMLPGRIEAQVRHLDQHPEVGLVLARHELLVAPGSQALAGRPRDRIFGDVGGVEPFAALVRRTVLDRVGPFDVTAGSADGLEWLTRAKRAGVIIAVHPDPLYRRRLHDGNWSHDRGQLRSDTTRALRRRIVEGRAVDPDPRV